jgi:hypothetical protein
MSAKGDDATMQRGTKAGAVSIWDRLRNARISRRRVPMVLTFSMLKQTTKAGHVLMMTVSRVKLKMRFACFCFNLMKLMLEKRVSVGSRWSQGMMKKRRMSEDRNRMRNGDASRKTHQNGGEEEMTPLKVKIFKIL